jgi:NADH-quinone oxidoreductase subunit J
MPAGIYAQTSLERGNFMERAFFLLFAAVAIGSGLMVVMARNPIHSALSLIVSLVQVAALFILLGSPFLAAIQIFVYVGAVMVLFLFVIMMLDVRKEARTRFLEKGIAPALVVLVLLGGEMIALLLGSQRFPVLSAGPRGSLRELSKTLFTDYLLPFEIASVILLVALVGAILLARKETD